jgi:hypothetical protein
MVGSGVAPDGPIVFALGRRHSWRVRIVSQPHMARLLVALLVLPLLLTVRPAAAGDGATLASSLGPAAASRLAGFRAVSVTFASPREGWVLGSVACGPARCLAIAHTVDAGRTWSRLPAPATTLSEIRGTPEGGSGVSALRFASARDGWAFGPELWATHDGGHTWHRSRVPGFGAAPVLALEAARGTVHAVLYDGAASFRIASSPTNREAWQLASLQIMVGAGPVPEIQLVLSGRAGWVLQNDRTVVNGARLVGGAWREWVPACASVIGPAQLAASSALDVVAVCDVGQWSTPAGERLFVSRDGGTTFMRTGPRLPTTGAFGVASPSRATIMVAGLLHDSLRLVGSFDGGRTWRTVLSLGGASPVDLGFTTPSQGVIVTGSGRLFMTRNGGHTWAGVTF